MKKIKLYDYQQEMLESIIKALSSASAVKFYNEKGQRERVGSSVMVQMPTGTGKTYVMASVVKWFLDSHDEGEVWIVAHRRELVEQMRQTLDRFCLEYGEKEVALKAKVRIRVLSIQWLGIHAGELEEAGCVPGLIVVDEAHHAIADSYQNLFDRNGKAMKLGMTATPCRMSRSSFTRLFDSLISSPCASDFIMRGYLSPYDYVVTGKFSADQLAVNQLRGRGSDGDYAVREMDEKLNIPQTIQRLYGSVKKYAEGKKGIVYAIDIAHAQAIAACYNALGLSSVALDSKTPAGRRKEMVEAFRRGEVGCLVNVNLFDEGFDCPDVEFIQMARPTLSLAKYLQMVGRGLRVNRENKDKVCVIIDNVGNYRKFGLPDKPRNWEGMFAGLRAGKGVVPTYVKKVRDTITVNDEMVTVKKANTSRRNMTAQQLREYLQGVEPFERDGRWGLRVKDDIIVKPVYTYLSGFKGDYVVCGIGVGRRLYGLLDRRGNVILPPEYKDVRLWNEHEVRVNKKHGGVSTIEL
ncbi:MAG TPA: hypothetical protein DDW22_02880 [Prevotellaceae bacterium]|nr:hypothetical protein [Prevotellaceae bacterium]